MNPENPSNPKEDNVEIPQSVYTRKDIIQALNPSSYSTFGKVPLSDITSAPIWSFSNATRKDLEKIGTSKLLSKGQFLGKASLGPIYSPKQNLVMKSEPQWSFPAEDKLKPIKEPYDYYHLQDKFTNLPDAVKFVKENAPVIHFKEAQRVFSLVWQRFNI